MNDNFPYIHHNGHWLRIEDPEGPWSLRKIAETVIGGLVMAGTLVLVMMAWLCM